MRSEPHVELGDRYYILPRTVSSLNHAILNYSRKGTNEIEREELLMFDKQSNNPAVLVHKITPTNYSNFSTPKPELGKEQQRQEGPVRFI